MQHLRTCSDDDDYAVVGGYTESSADTDELISGRVDWGLAAGSDDEMERYGTVVRRAPPPPGSAAAEAAARADAQRRAPLGERVTSFDPQDWMFDMTRRGAEGDGAGGASGSGAPHVGAVNPAAAAVGWATQQAAAQGQTAAAPQRPPPAQQQRPQQPQAQALPGDLDARLDAMFADFAAQQRGRRASSDGGAEVAGVERVALPARAEGAAPAVRFANSLPPPQEDFRLEYSDAPRTWLRQEAGGGFGSIIHTAAPAAAEAATAPAAVQAPPPQQQQPQQQRRPAPADPGDMFSIARRPPGGGARGNEQTSPPAAIRARHPAMG